MEIDIRQGDIATVEADAIVCPANTDLVTYAGIAGRLKQLGGPTIEVEARAHAPAQLGQVVPTNGGTLKTGVVLHAVVMGYRPEDLAAAPPDGALVADDVLHDATREVLACATRYNLHAIAVPDLGELAAFTTQRAAAIVLSAVMAHAREHPGEGPERVTFVLPVADSVDAYRAAWAAIPPDDAAGVQPFDAPAPEGLPSCVAFVPSTSG